MTEFYDIYHFLLTLIKFYINIVRIAASKPFLAVFLWREWHPNHLASWLYFMRLYLTEKEIDPSALCCVIDWHVNYMLYNKHNWTSRPGHWYRWASGQVSPDIQTHRRRHNGAKYGTYCQYFTIKNIYCYTHIKIFQCRTT